MRVHGTPAHGTPVNGTQAHDRRVHGTQAHDSLPHKRPFSLLTLS
jgi:hypothetical protein